MRLYRDKKIKAFESLAVFGAADISDAFRYFSGRNRIGKIAISFDDVESMIKVRCVPPPSPAPLKCPQNAHLIIPYRSFPQATIASSLPRRPTSYPGVLVALAVALPNGW